MAEKQAEAYRRSLVNEGISKPKAQELAVRKTVELCRRTTRSEIVKSVLASSRFDTPTEVLAKYVTENEIAYKERRESEKFKQNNKGKHNKHNDKNGKPNKFNRFKQGNGGNNNGNFNKNGNFKGNKSGNIRNNRNNRNGEATIRFVQGNEPGPSTGGPSGEQIFHLPFNQ